jgi:hypothetical protein
MADYFADDAPQIDFGDGSFLIYSHLYVPPAEIDLGPVLDQTLEVWDWKGTNPRIESQGPDRRTDAIQYRVVKELQKEDFDVIFDDDGSHPSTMATSRATTSAVPPTADIVGQRGHVRKASKAEV